MDIYPQDLARPWHVALLRKRLLSANAPIDDLPAPRLGRLGRLWSGGSGLTPEAAAIALPVFKDVTLSSMIPLLAMAVGAGIMAWIAAFNGIRANAGLLQLIAITASGLLAGVGVVGLPLVTFHRTHRKPLTVGDVDVLLTRTNDDVQRAYLGLLREAVRQPLPPEVQIGVRTTLRTLAKALESLPMLPDEPDVARLEQEAVGLRAQAHAETDEATARILNRRADTLQSRIEVVRQSAALLRRTAASRQELQEQLETLRVSLATHGTRAGSVADFQNLAEQVQASAAEAASIAAAREELDRSLASDAAVYPATVDLPRNGSAQIPERPVEQVGYQNIDGTSR